VHHGLEHAGRDPAQRGGDLVRVLPALRGIGRHQGQIRGDTGHSSSDTSDGYGWRDGFASMPQAYQVHDRR
jgi:hypothetical protein